MPIIALFGKFRRDPQGDAIFCTVPLKTEAPV